MAHAYRSSRSPAKIGLAVILIVLLGYNLSLAAREGLAELYEIPATALMDSWQEAALTLAEQQSATSANAPTGETNVEETAFVPPEQEWNAVLNNLRIAAKLSPTNPVYQANLGRLYQFKLDDSALDVSELESTGLQAVTHFKQAAYYRPTWTYHWWDVASTEYQLYRYHTPSYQQALRHTATFGPWLTDAQLFVADLALDTWESIDNNAQQTALANIDRALLRQPDEIIGLIDNYKAWNNLCVIARNEAISPYPNIKSNCPQTTLLTEAQLIFQANSHEK